MMAPDAMMSAKCNKKSDDLKNINYKKGRNVKIKVAS